MRTFLTVLFLSAVVFTISAQEVPPVLMVKEGSRSRQLEISAVDIKARISGAFAETAVTLTFTNNSNRALAGDLYFPLPEGAVLSGYALDIDGTMIDGVVVERQKARQVFEKIVRQGIDPGLLEWVQGNHFKTRIFPIPPRGTRTVRIRYHGELKVAGDLARYRLPLNFQKRIPKVNFAIEVLDPGDVPVVVQSPLRLSFEPLADRHTARAVGRRIPLDEDLIFSVPALDSTITVEQSDRSANQVYFAIHHRPPTASASTAAPSPDKITLYWDASQSMRTADLQLVQTVLAAWLKKFSRIDVELIVFRDSAEAAKIFTLRRGDSSDLITELGDLVYDGGTQLGAVPKPSADSDLVLFVSDGLSTFGADRPPIFNVPVFALSASAGADFSSLHALSLESSGAYFNLLETETYLVVQRIGHPVYRFLGARVLSGSVEEGFPRLPQPVGQRFTFTGRLESESAEIELQYGVGSQITHRQRFAISRRQSVDGGLLRLIWAGKKLADLQIYPKRNRALIMDLGKEYGLVTPGTSLIVLESLQQYVNHRIPPPSTLPKLRREYNRRIAEIEQEQSQQQESKLQYVLELWAGRAAWWRTNFMYPKDFRYQEEEAKEDASEAPASQPMAESVELLSATLPEAEVDISRAEAKKAVDQAEDASPMMLFQAWDPDTPYLSLLKKASANERYKVYLQQRERYGSSPSFYLDCGDYFSGQGDRRLSLRIWSNLAEIQLTDPALLRILGHRLAQADHLQLSALIFREVLLQRPEEPQSYRDLGLVLGRLGFFAEAIDLLYAVVMRPWDRFQEIELAALMELNAIIPRARQAGVTRLAVDPRLIKLLDVDLRIILTWDADLTDMDLWVTEPSGEKAYYGHRQTTIGGNMSTDFTEGYGPEEYLLRKAMKGVYLIDVNYFSNRAPDLTGSVTLQVELFTNYGRASEERRAITIRLRESTETLRIGEIRF